MIPSFFFSWKNNRPKFVLIIDESKNFKKIIHLWSGSTTIKEALEKEKIVAQLMVKCDSFITNCYKRILNYFGDQDFGDVYDFPIGPDLDEKELITEYSKNKSDFGQEWQLIRGNASYVYHKIERRGIINEYKLVYPKYSLDVFTGRSKTVDVVIQGFDDTYNIKHPNSAYNILVHFDWISADFRMAAIMSQDTNLLQSFDKGDPYSYIEEQLDGSVNRSDCKEILLKSTYSLDYNSEIFMIYPKFGEWIKKQADELKINNYSKSMLGRKFHHDGSYKSEKRCINAIMQGSVAHAMNSVIHRCYEQCGNIILTEQHDSLTIATTSNMFKFIVDTISQIMFKPFESLDITMPLKISVGKKWNVYKYFKECR